jgi:DnaJ-class molecular chaperone
MKPIEISCKECDGLGVAIDMACIHCKGLGKVVE